MSLLLDAALDYARRNAAANAAEVETLRVAWADPAESELLATVLADAGNASAERMWCGLGGAASPSHRFQWYRAMRPGRLAV